MDGFVGGVSHAAPVNAMGEVKKMFNWMRRRIIGGESGKREVTLFVFAVVALAGGYAIYQESQGAAMQQTFALLMVAFPSAVAALLGAYGLEHWKPKQ